MGAWGGGRQAASLSKAASVGATEPVTPEQSGERGRGAPCDCTWKSTHSVGSAGHGDRQG